MSIRLNVMKFSGFASGVLMALALTSAANASTTTMTSKHIGDLDSGRPRRIRRRCVISGIGGDKLLRLGNYFACATIGPNWLERLASTYGTDTLTFATTQGRKYGTTAGTILLSIQIVC